MYQTSQRLRRKDRHEWWRSKDDRDYYLPAIARKLAQAPEAELEKDTSAAELEYELGGVLLDCISNGNMVELAPSMRRQYTEPQPFVREVEGPKHLLGELKNWARFKRQVKKGNQVVQPSAAEWESAVRKAGGRIVK